MPNSRNLQSELSFEFSQLGGNKGGNNENISEVSRAWITVKRTIVSPRKIQELMGKRHQIEE
jgi:hypothetical protein